MDKLFRNSWFIKIISFVIAVMLFTFVTKSEDQNNNNMNYQGNGNDVQTINQELTANYDSDKYIVLGLPSSVQVRLTGSTESITNAKLQTTHKAFVNLKDKKPGRYEVNVQTSGFPSSIGVEVIPSTLNVTIQKKVTKSFPVSIDLLNRANIADGYTVGEYKVDPETISVTGGEDIVDQIAFIKGVVDLKDVTDSVDKTIPINAYDKDGNQLMVNLRPSTVNVQIPIDNPSKEVPLKISPKGSPAKGQAIEGIEMDPETVKVFGDKDLLDGIKEISDLEVSVDGLEKTKTIQVDVPVPKGAQKVEPDKIDVTVHIGKSTTRTIEGIPIILNDLASEDRKVTFLSPKSRQVTIKLTGAEKLLDQLKRIDIEATIDISKLKSGEHEVPIDINLPDYLDYSLGTTKAKIDIEKEEKSSDEEEQQE